MTTKKPDGVNGGVQELLGGDRKMIKALLKEAPQGALDGEMGEFLGAQAHERTETRKGSRADRDRCRLLTRIGTIELWVLWDRCGVFLTALFERDAHSEKASVAALTELIAESAQPGAHNSRRMWPKH